MRSYIDGLLRYFEFSGRSTRAQYWLFGLVSFVVIVAALFADAALSGVPVGMRTWGGLTVFATIFHVIPGISVTVRRLHDSGRSGWWYFISLVPFGSLLLLVWMCWPSDDSGNDYGDHPRDGERRYEPRQRQSRNYSTIPRNVRMGSSAGRPPSIDGGSSPQRFI